MNTIVKGFIIVLLLVQSVFAIDNKYYHNKFNATKKLYLGSIMSNDREKEIEYLKKLIQYGNKLNVSTLKYKRELNRLDNKAVLKNTTKSILPQKKYSIRSVVQKSNSIIINFTKKIDKTYIDFKEKKVGKTYYDEFYIKGNFKDASPTKLSIKGVDKIKIYQKGYNNLALVLKNRKNLKTIYVVNKKQIIIKVLDLNKKNAKKSQNAKKLNVSTSKYKRELNKLYNKPSVPQKKYSISSVVQKSNSIIINFTQKIDKTYIDFKEKKVGKTYYDEFYVKGNFKDASPTKFFIKGVDKIKIYQKEYNNLALVLKNRKNLKTIYVVNKKQIIIKVLDLDKKAVKKSQQKQNKKIKQEVKVIQNDILYPSKKVIVIDAGHGGRDGGAHYKKKRFEKDITLRISKYLKTDLERKGFKVFLTRTRDKYVRLSKRTKYANSKHADIFISIHANAAPNKRAKDAHGVESYFLSPARSARAKRVAALENKGDMTGMGWSSKNSLLTILNRAKITAANKMAIDIQKHMLYDLRKQYGKNAIRDGGVREGPFWVLVGAQMPSVLVEVGYISHPQEGYRISTKRYQKLIAKGISNGVESYFIKN